MTSQQHWTLLLIFFFLDILSSFCFQDSICFQFLFFPRSSLKAHHSSLLYFQCYGSFSLSLVPSFFNLYSLLRQHSTFPCFMYHLLFDDFQMYVFKSFLWTSLWLNWYHYMYILHTPKFLHFSKLDHGPFPFPKSSIDLYLTI